MAEFLLNKLINREVNSQTFIKWLVHEDLQAEDDDYEVILSSKVGRIDFVTYFLNFVHEEVPCKDTTCQTPRKLSTPRHLEQNTNTPKLSNSTNRNNFKKMNLFESKTSCDKNCASDKTPKKPETSSNSSQFKENSYMSPVSPLYAQNFTPREQKIQNTSRNSSEKSTLCLGDFIVTAKNSSKKKKHFNTACKNQDSADAKKLSSRRINPTNLNQKNSNHSFQKTGNSFNFKEIDDKNILNSERNVNDTRSIFVEERLKILSKKEDLLPVIPKKINTAIKNEIEPKLSAVSFKKQLDLLIDVYVTILNNRMVLNVTSEVYFLVSLLLSRQEASEKCNSKLENTKIKEELSLGVDFLDIEQNNEYMLENNRAKVKRTYLYNSEVFESVHNIVYFASKCLETQLEILKCLDKATLRLLADNPRFKEMSINFCKQLLSLAFKKCDRLSEISNQDTQTNVCFNADTDNIQNFPDQLHFHAFRKQRDLFYEILRIWESSHMLPDWQFSISLGGKIRSLFNLCQEPLNFVHLSRLFKDQLLKNCVKNNNKETGLSENLSKLPSSLANIDSEKLNLLTNRLVSKPTSSGINSVPNFSGYQEFYKEFIIVASDFMFNKHLCDCLVFNILELSDAKILNCDMEDPDSQVDQTTRKAYSSGIKKLRTLAKFLGFVESIPYKSESLPNSKDLIQIHINIRSQISPYFDVKTLLEKAIEKKTLILVIPWLAKYLSMLDYVTLRVPYYHEVSRLLFEIYHRKFKQKTESLNDVMIAFALGWLFELPHFPEDEYFNFCSKNKHNKIDNLTNGNMISNQPKYLDDLDIIDQNILYLCCPYLEEIKKLLSSNIRVSKKVTVKHITPVTASESNNEMMKKKIEQQLEDAFFNGQPASLRKTVEFVSERVASSAVKFFCHTLVPKSKEKALKEFKKMLIEIQEDMRDRIGDDDTQYKALLKQKSFKMAQTHLSLVISSCNSEMLQIAKEKIPPAIDSLLSLDSLAQTKEFCVNVTTKMYVERVKQWVASHVNLMVFSKDFDHEVQKVILGKKLDKDKTAFVLPSGGRNTTHNENCLSGFYVLLKIKDLICDITEDSLKVCDVRVLNTLEETLKSLEQRNDINDTLLTNICCTAFDLCILLASHKPLTISQFQIEIFTKIWKHHPKLEQLFKNILSTRNIRIIQDSRDKSKSWDVLAKIIAQLVETKLLQMENFESQCTGFYQNDWEKDVLEQYSTFLKLVSCHLSKNNELGDKFGFMLEFLSDFCSDL